MNDEMTNIYHDIDNVLNKSTVTVHAIVASTATITKLTVTTLSGFSQKIAQVKKFCTESNTSSTNTSYVDTALTLGITPTLSANSILVLVAVNGFDNTGAFKSFLTIARGGTDLLSGNGGVGFGSNVPAGTNQNPMNVSFVYSDAPASTSALTYTVQIKTSNAGGSARAGAQGQTQCIVLMEYAP